VDWTERDRAGGDEQAKADSGQIGEQSGMCLLDVLQDSTLHRIE
jgi:hypothetical protein